MKMRRMTVEDLKMVLDWAKDEGWNPGLDDAPAFFAADPNGFFLAEVEGAPAAAISVVNHCDRQAFLGLYICRPDFRGQGIGIALWKEALLHAGDRAVGLDGVPDQQDNYARSGFEWLSRTVRFRGIAPSSGAGTRLATEADLPYLIAADRRAVGFDRVGFASAWFTSTATRQTVILERGGDPQGFATFRQCHEGVKIGPLQAKTSEDAEMLLAACPKDLSPDPLFVDIPDGSHLRATVEALGFEPVFETARMVKGDAAIASPPAYFGVTTLELG